MAPILKDRLLFLEARVAMIEDRLDYYRSQVRLIFKSLLGWAELVAFWVAIRVFLHYAPDLKPKEKK